MSGSPEFEINEPLYQWCVRAFSLLRHRLGINISVHDNGGLLNQGQIFLFNHFARFETIIPQYFIHQAGGGYCRCVATHELFQGSERFSKFIKNLGAVPNNHPGLLAFLAAEILRGRKVIIFPEGSMVKDRQIAAALPSKEPRSAHRQGAAALAVILEIFKKRILSVHEAGDLPRLNRWVAALGLADRSALIAAAHQPTLVVPANITFYPIHTGANFLARAAEFLSLDIGEKAKEELLIESNLVFRDTDMDIRLGQPFHPDAAWNVADRMIFDRIFEQIDSLDDLFGLKDTASRWIERMAALIMRRTTRRLRDLCMAEMYARVTVNLNHLASRLLLRLMQTGETEIARDRFHGLLYRIVKEVQLLPDLHLHRTLTDPEIYDGIHDGTNSALEQFFEAATASGLIEVTPSHYRLLPALRNGTGKRDPRLENIVRVYANEVALLPAVTGIVENAVPARGADLAHLLFDDELRAHALRKRSFTDRRYAMVDNFETADKNGEPYFLVPSKPTKSGVVLVHGFLASPAELKYLGHRLAGLGHPVLGVRLKGHGTSPWDLRACGWQDWLASVKRGYEMMSHVTREVLLAGFGTGASMTLHLAAAQPPGLAGVVAVSVPLRFRARNLAFAPLIHGLNKLSEWVYVQDGIKPFQTRESEHPNIDYLHMPVRGLVELRKVADELERRLPDIVCPAAIIHGTDDPVADPESARIIHARIGSPDKSLHMIPSQRHGILHEDIAGTMSLVMSLLEGWAVPKIHPSATPPRDPLVPKLKAAVTRSFAPWFQRFRNTAPSPQPQPHPWEKSYPDNVDWHAVIQPKPLPTLFDEAAAAHAARVCMSFRKRQYRYREVAQLIDKAAKGFRALGVRRGIKVGLVLPNCPYAVICFFAVLKAGGTVVNINPLYSHIEIARQAADSDARIMVSLDVKVLYEKIAGLVAAPAKVEKLIVCRMKGALGFTEKLLYSLFKSAETASVSEDDSHIFFERLIDNDGAFQPPAIDAATDVAVLQYTGGTTGLPKGAALTHANLYVNAAQLALWAPGVPPGREKSLAVLPLFHSFGMTAVMNLGLMVGAEMILVPRFGAAEVLAVIDRERPSIFIGVPTMFSALLEHRDIAKHDLTCLKHCISGGAPLPLALQRRFEDVTGCKIVEGYGLSEASPVCTVNPLSGGKPGSAGLPLPGTVIEIMALDNPDKLLGPGERGEICITGPQVMAGYANRAAENVEAFRGARLHTGDVGYLDEDGYLFIVDRIKELILSSGFNVYPRQVEEAIMTHPAVAEAAVCGVPDAHRGEIVKAYVRLREGEQLTAAALRGFLAKRLAPFELPRSIEFRASLPHTLMGKVAKKDLMAEAAAPETETAKEGQPTT
jgi:acyl-CoA synthetase (AMP-forming)/AMP-acid ligase II/esterase/lipase